MECVMCKGRTSPAVRPQTVERDGRRAVVDDVPVEVCDACGEVYIDDDVVLQLGVLLDTKRDGPGDDAVGHHPPS